MIVYGGRYHEASRDLGDAVELIVPDVRLPLRGGGARPRGERNSAWRRSLEGNRTRIEHSKSDAGAAN